MSDSAQAFTKKPYGIGIVDGQHVNHSRKPTPELSRSCEVLKRVGTTEKRAAVCSTNFIDPTWKVIKGYLPDRMSARTEAEREKARPYVRMGQWKIMVGTGDKWAAFVEAARVWEAEQRANVDG